MPRKPIQVAADLPGRFRRLRELLGFTQESLAKASGLDRLQVNGVERGVNKLSSDALLRKLAHGMGASTDLLRAFRDGELTPEEFAAQRGQQRPAVQASASEPAAEPTSQDEVVDALMLDGIAPRSTVSELVASVSKPGQSQIALYLLAKSLLVKIKQAPSGVEFEVTPRLPQEPPPASDAAGEPLLSQGRSKSLHTKRERGRAHKAAR